MLQAHEGALLFSEHCILNKKLQKVVKCKLLFIYE